MIQKMEIGGNPGDSPSKGFASPNIKTIGRGGSIANKGKAQPTLGIHNLLVSNSQEQLHKIQQDKTENPADDASLSRIKEENKQLK